MNKKERAILANAFINNENQINALSKHDIIIFYTSTLEEVNNHIIRKLNRLNDKEQLAVLNYINRILVTKGFQFMV